MEGWRQGGGRVEGWRGVEAGWRQGGGVEPGCGRWGRGAGFERWRRGLQLSGVNSYSREPEWTDP